MKTYEIKYEPITKEGKILPKYNIYYYIDNSLYTKEFHSTDGINGIIREGFKKKDSFNWKGLSQDLFYSSLFQKAMMLANPNAYSTLLKVLTDGENNFASENAFLQAFTWMGVPFTEEEKNTLNDILNNNGFTVRV